MSRRVEARPSAEFSADEYIDDFGKVYAVMSGDLVKLETTQFFREPGNASWEAANSGQWGLALRKAAEAAPEYRDEFAGLERRGLGSKRVKYCRMPPTPYLQWEFEVLRVRAEAGEMTRVVVDSTIPEEFRDLIGLELVMLGEDVLYEVLYSEQGELRGARAYRDPATIRRYLDPVERLFSQGEPLIRFFDREIAGLVAPTSLE